MASLLDQVVPVFGLQRKESLGFLETGGNTPVSDSALLVHTNLKLAALGLSSQVDALEPGVREAVDSLLKSYREQSRLLESESVSVDARIEAFLKSHFADVESAPELKLPKSAVSLDRHGMARLLSLPATGDVYKSDIVSSYRIKNGVLNNPRHDRRTTKGTFHVAEGGLPISGDKRSVPKHVFAKLFQVAMNPPKDSLQLPFTSESENPAETFVSLYLRPLVCPEVPGITPHKSMEVRFFVPGAMVSNLDFVESIFGNAGDALLPENDAALDVEHWTGTTGCVILAPQMSTVTKKDLGLPHYDEATERQRQDSMCWKDESELYNDGTPFKLTCRDENGVVVTLIADNYYGYCKKEVKTQISYSANLIGNVEEEHAGGAIAYASYSLGEKFQANSIRYNGRTFDDVVADYQQFIDVKPEGYGIDKNFPNLYYIPEDAFASLRSQHITWMRDGKQQEIPLLPGNVYMAPSGYQLRMEKHPKAPSWRLIGTVAEGVYCHKPCTVSGGGKSEISKSLIDYMHYGPLFVADYDHDFAQVQEIFEKNYEDRWNPEYKQQPSYDGRQSRPILGPERSLGSVIKLLTPSSDYNESYNEWLRSIPDYIYSLVFIIKRFEEEGWGNNWRDHFGVDIVNGHPGHELKFRDRTLVGTYLRVGLLGPRQWRTYKLRQDFAAAQKIQTEDDISCSIVLPTHRLNGLGDRGQEESVKFVLNCEYRLFQRPDEAIHRGFDKQAEADLASANNFISNFEPLTRDDVSKMAEYVADFDAFSQPMQNLLTAMLEEKEGEQSKYVVCSANPRLIDGQPSKNPRYLQDRPDMVDAFPTYVAERGLRLYRKIPADQPVRTPVDAVLLGRRNNPPDKQAGIRSLAVYNPIHYQELPELFMDFMCSLTGKSPSTTGFGSEGALTKGPFNALRPAADLNAAFLSYVLTGLGGYSSAAGHIGPEVRVDHDISLLVPEIWCRLTPEERSPEFLIAEGCLEKMEDKVINGETVLCSRLGYRITSRFVRRYFGRVFDNPAYVFDDSILQPELQDSESFYDGIKYICEAHRQVATRYIEDGTVDQLVPPLKALAYIMSTGSYEGKTIQSPEFREMFTREAILKSEWYQARLDRKQTVDTNLLKRHEEALNAWVEKSGHSQSPFLNELKRRQEWVKAEQGNVETTEYRENLVGTLGVHTF